MKELATLGGGCFWCIEAIYQIVEGITSITSGYSGGHVNNPTYQQVCMGNTGHAEVVQLEFDPEIISYQHILEIFFTVHDPTSLNRQGADVGTQYRSIILYHSADQEKTAREVIAQLEQEKSFNSPIVTEVEKLETFFPAEEYHQKYFERNPYQGYCRIVISPKFNKFKKQYQSKELP